MISEAEFQTQVIELAHLYGYLCAHFRPVRIQRKDGSVYYATPVQADGRGWPDVVLVRNPVSAKGIAELGPGIIAAELKRSSREKVTLAQRAWLEAFRAAGIPAYVWTPEDFDSIKEILQ